MLYSAARATAKWALLTNSEKLSAFLLFDSGIGFGTGAAATGGNIAAGGAAATIHSSILSGLYLNARTLIPRIRMGASGGKPKVRVGTTGKQRVRVSADGKLRIRMDGYKGK